VFGRFEADRPNELWVGDVLSRTRHKASPVQRGFGSSVSNRPKVYGGLPPGRVVNRNLGVTATAAGPHAVTTASATRADR
jgi:hypothetical protein